MSQEIKCLKSRRARKVVPAQDIDMNQLMQNYGLESDSEESADEDFSPTNVESNSSEDSQNESSSSSSSDDDNDEVTSNDKKSAAVPSDSNNTTPLQQPQQSQQPLQQVKVSPQTLLQEQSKQKQQQQQLLVQFQQLPSELQQLVVQQLQAQKLPKQQQSAQQQSIQQQLQLQLAKLQLLQQQLQKQQLPKQQLPQQLFPKQPLLQQQLLKQQSSQQQLPQQQSPQQQIPQQQSSQEQTKKKQFLQPPHLKQQQQHLAQKQLPSQPQNTPVQFSQLPSKVQELLVKQLQQSGQGLQQLQQSKFLLLNAQQATTITTTTTTATTSSSGGSSGSGGCSGGSSGSSSSSSSSKLLQKGEVQTGSPSKQASDKVTKITVKQMTGAVRPSSTSKQVTKKVVQIATKQATAEQPPSQQKKSGHTYEKSQPQEVCIKDTANTKGIEINEQQAKRDDEPHPHKQQPPKTTMSQDSEDMVSEQKKKVQTSPVVSSPVQKETDAVETLTKAVKKEVDIMLCFVCLEESKASGEDMAQCDHCGITVHEGCYGVPEKSDDEEEEDARSDLSSEVTTPWFCDSCRAGVDQPSCELCPSTDGVFKQTIHGSWVHMVCSLYIPGVEYVEPEILSGVSLDQVPANKWGARVCQLCEDERYARTGVCISCDAGLCKSFFHVTCAQRQGLLCEEEENSEDDEEEVEVADPYYAYCKLHCNKDVAKSKRRNWLALMSHYKQFSCDHLDNRAKSALLDQRSQYHDLMENMRKYYKPDEQCIKQERWLHHHPKAFRQLVKKAELLGHASDTIVTATGGRSKVTPSLTCDFVNYYIERNGRIKNLQELNDKLVLTNQLLSEDCDQLQDQVSAYELNQNSVQLQSVELQEQLGGLYKCIQAGCGKPLPMPSFLSDDTGNDRMDDQKSKKCSVCSSSSDQHLVITCDTCDKHYHIGCLDPPLTKVPKKSTNYGWQCETCCCDSEDDLRPSIAPDGATSSRSGRVINRPSSYKQSEETHPQQKAKKRKK